MAGFNSASVISQGTAWPLTPTPDPGRSQTPVRASPAVVLLACHWSCGQSHIPGRSLTGPQGRGRWGVEVNRV